MIMSKIYETKDGKFYQKTNKYRIIICALIATTLLFGYLFISSSIESNKLRTTNDGLTEQLDRATSTCNELRGTIANCQSICRDIDELNTRSISTTREAIEIIEETREAVGAMEVALGLFDSDGYYDWLDSYVFDNEVKDEGVDFIK